MSVDLVCAGAAFFDITFVGLEAMPEPGEERHARDLLRTPGGAALIAIAAARLGLDVALCSPLGADAEGESIRAALTANGVRFTGRKTRRTPVTVVLPVDGDRAMATYHPAEPVTAKDLAAVPGDAAVLGPDQVRLAPHQTRLFVTMGDAEARAGLRPDALAGAHAVLVNEREARLLTGRQRPEDSARALAEHVPCAVVTCGAAGAVGADVDDVVRVPGIQAPTVDTTGAGDLFCAAYVWADTLRLTLADRLRWAVLYAALSVGVPTGFDGAVTREQLVAAGERIGLAAPAQAEESMIRRRS